MVLYTRGAKVFLLGLCDILGLVIEFVEEVGETVVFMKKFDDNIGEVLK